MVPHSAPTIALSVLLTMGHSLYAFATPAANSTHGAGGWHFYETPKDDPPPVEVQPVAPPAPAEPAPPDPSSGPAPLSAAWIRANIERFRDAAIDNPTPENIDLYAYLQRTSMDKAERFAQAMTLSTLRNPYLDETARSPTTGIQKATADQVMSAAKKTILDKLVNEHGVGIWYFYLSTCPYCARQEPILEQVMRRTNISVLPISLDGMPPPTAPWQYVVNDGHAEQLNVHVTPTLVLAKPPYALINLSTGLRTVSEIEERIIQVARAERWITENEYDEAVRGDPRQFITDGFVESETPPPEDPAALLEFLRTAAMVGGASNWANPPAPASNQQMD